MPGNARRQNLLIVIPVEPFVGQYNARKHLDSRGVRDLRMVGSNRTYGPKRVHRVST